MERFVFKPVIQKTRTLVLMAIVNLLLVFWAFNSKVIDKSPGYNEKIEAANTMNKGLKILEKYQREENNIDQPDNAIDPNGTRLIPKEESPIRSANGKLLDKQAALKPNFAGIVVDLLIKAGLTKGDTVAACITGSLPGANLALYSATKAMGLNLFVITSVAASTWGATDPEFTWLDMEKILKKNKIIDNISIAASIGGRSDYLRKAEGMKLGGPRGRALLDLAISRNKIPLIPYDVKGDSLIIKSIQKRLEFFNSITNINNYNAYINIGGGVASVGIGGWSKLKNKAIYSPEAIKTLELKESLINIFSKKGKTVINIMRISDLIHDFLPPGAKQYEIGEGELYQQERYDLLIAIIATFLSIIMIMCIGWYSKHQINEQLKSYEVESII